MGPLLHHSRFYSRRVRQAGAVSLQFFLLLGIVVYACHAAVPLGDMVQVKVQRVAFDPVSRSPVILLLDNHQARLMPIWIGHAEARAIESELRGERAARPLTHDLLKNILVQVGVQFEKIVVNGLKDSTYYARIHLSAGGTALTIDSRPSDAIALALRFGRPMFVAKGLLESASAAESPNPKGRGGQTSARISGVTVQNISPDLAGHFQLTDTSGVLVADVDTAGQTGVSTSATAHLRRGDIILTVAGQTIHNVAEFEDTMGGQASQSRKSGRAVDMLIQRDGKALGIAYPLIVE